MKPHFDSKQDLQSIAIKSITDIFKGQPLSSGNQVKTNIMLQMRDTMIDFKTI